MSKPGSAIWSAFTVGYGQEWGHLKRICTSLKWSYPGLKAGSSGYPAPPREGSTPAVRPGRSGPFRLETITLDDVAEIGGIQMPLNPRPVREFTVPLTQRRLRVCPILVIELAERCWPRGEFNQFASVRIRKSATNAPGA
jgi:hypothetical protein